MEKESGQTGSSARLEAPRGFHSARVDEKGRLKLPAAIAEYLSALGEQKVFVTTINGSTVQIYPISVWRENETLLEEGGADNGMKEDVAFVAFHYGADSDIDAQGRVLVPQELRKKLGMEGAQVHLRWFKQRLEVIGDDIYQQRLNDAMNGFNGKSQALAGKGLK